MRFGFGWFLVQTVVNSLWLAITSWYQGRSWKVFMSPGIFWIEIRNSFVLKPICYISRFAFHTLTFEVLSRKGKFPKIMLTWQCSTTKCSTSIGLRNCDENLKRLVCIEVVKIRDVQLSLWHCWSRFWARNLEYRPDVDVRLNSTCSLRPRLRPNRALPENDFDDWALIRFAVDESDGLNLPSPDPTFVVLQMFSYSLLYSLLRNAGLQFENATKRIRAQIIPVHPDDTSVSWVKRELVRMWRQSSSP